MKNLTLVTALYDIGRESISKDFSRKFSDYLKAFEKLLKLDYPMVIYCDEAVEKFILKHRTKDNTHIIRKELASFREFPFFDQVQKIRTNHKWIEQSSWIKDSPQATLEYYNPLVLSKQFMLNDASIYNTFNTKYLAWIDAGLANTVNLDQYFTDEMHDKLCANMNKLLYIAFPYDGKIEVHGFPKPQMNNYACRETEYVVRGGFFGGTKESINEFNSLYYELLDGTINAGLMGTEESLFTILSYQHPTKINLKMIESNGLVYKFFDDLKHNKTQKIFDNNIAIYSLTYNQPKQWELWAESFMDAYPREFKASPKYVVNNSDDPSVDEEYKRLFKKFGFFEFKHNNIGINDGRHQIAVHFDQSTHSYMIFFEDDMLLHDKKNKKSKSGFDTYHQDVFEISKSIIEIEQLDYLKLSFDEVFGNALENWGWVNIRDKEKRAKYFPDNDKRTVVKHLGVVKGVPYSVGEYHYCNWPILFTKTGNKKIFLEKEVSHKYEQTWMAMTAIAQKEGTILAGCLLMSIINHCRKFNYDQKKRRENKFYKN